MADTLLGRAYSEGYITREEKFKVDAYKHEMGVGDDVAIKDLKLMSEEKILDIYSDIYGYPKDSEAELTDSSVAKMFQNKQLAQFSFVPDKNEDRITIIFSQPSNLLFCEDMVHEITGYQGRFDYLLTTQSQIQHILQTVFAGEKNGELDISGIEGEGTGIDVYSIVENDSSAVVNLINRIIREAVEQKISDIHFEPQFDGLHVRYRIDGSLKRQYLFPINISHQIINRIKIMSGRDVNNSHIIQDGNAQIDIFGNLVDLRVSIVPAIYGENLVVRVLDRNKMDFDIDMIGFSEKNKAEFLKAIQRPQGMILLTGPTGSGKSTSLYAAVSYLNTEDKCIITFEDPVEYRIPGIVQVQVNPNMDVTFANALKAGLRQDIDVALVGEIRGDETATTAFEAANTGHLVFSTLHTNSCAATIQRLIDLGVEPQAISQSLIAIINQRLVKRICPHCKEEYMLEATSPFRKVLGCGDEPVRLYRGTGCKKCDFTGYKGRIAIQEFMIVNKAICSLLEKGASANDIEAAAVENGMIRIHDDGIQKALEGLTTLEEIHKNVFFEEL